MRTTMDVSFSRVLSAPTWRARFFHAAAHASESLVAYSIKHQDSENAAMWMERLRFFRAKAALFS